MKITLEENHTVKIKDKDGGYIEGSSVEAVLLHEILMWLKNIYGAIKQKG